MTLIHTSGTVTPKGDNNNPVPRAERHQLDWMARSADAQPAKFLHDHMVSSLGADNRDAEDANTSTLHFNLDLEVSTNISRFCRIHKVDSSAALLAAIRACHYRMTRVQDAAIATAPSWSRQLMDIAKIYCVQAPIGIDTTYKTLTQCVSEGLSTVRVPGDGHHETLGSEFGATLAAFFNGRLERYSGGPESGHAFEIIFQLFCSPCGVLSGEVDFDNDCFESSTVQTMIDGFCDCLRHGLDFPDTTIACLPLTTGLPQEESPQIGQADYPRDSSIIDVFRWQADLVPKAIAVRESGSQVMLTYAQLDHQSEMIASHLRRLNSPPGTPIAVLAPRSCETIAGFLGILKANLAYLPLDPMLPVERIKAILASLHDCRLLLIGKDVPPPCLHIEGVELLRLSALPNSGSGKDSVEKGSPERGSLPSASSLAYILFTSGSSGMPKGVMIEHRGVVRLVRNGSTVQTLPRTPRIANLSNLMFDASTWEIYSALLNGGTVICIDQTTVLDLEDLARVFDTCQVDGAVLTPTLLKQCWNSSLLYHLKVLHLAGEPLSPFDAVKARDAVPGFVYNTYGPTENTVASTMFLISRDAGCDFPNGVPVGRTIRGSGAYVLDERQCLVPRGVIGELVVTGDGLARGYTNPALNADRFVHIMIGATAVRAYRTGDIARVRFDNEIEYHGRIDQQIKVRGHRVEVAEIEQAIMRSHERAIGAAVVQSRHDDRGSAVVAFVAIECDRSAATSLSMIRDIKARLQTMLPTYMLPEKIILLSELPMNPSGKLDRKQLTVLAEREDNETWSLPDVGSGAIDSIQAALSEELERILGTRVGLTDNFFDLGGNSITAMRLTARLTERLNLRLSVKDVFDHPTLSELATAMRALEHLPCTSVSQASRSERAPLSFAQSRLWFLNQLGPETTADLIPICVRLRGTLQLEHLASALATLQARHEVLRTTLAQSQQDDVATQFIHSSWPVPLSFRTIEDEGQLIPALRDTLQPFNLSREPGWRTCIIQIAPEDAVLSIVMHHIICDGWSVDLFCHELTTLYAAACNGSLQSHPLLKPLDVHYRDFAAWQQSTAQLADQKKQLEYWKEHMEDHIPAVFLYDFPRPQARSYEAGVLNFSVSEHSTVYQDNLRAICSAEQVTPFVVLLAAFRAMHYRFTEAADATIGIPITNRGSLGLQSVMGLFVNLVPIRTRMDDETAFSTLLRRVKDLTAAAMANQDVPFESIVSATETGARDPSRNPLVQTLFAHHTQLDLGEMSFDGLESTSVALQQPSTRFDMEFHLYETRSGIKGSVLYANDLFKPATIRCIVDVFQEILRTGLNDTVVACLPLCNAMPGVLQLNLATPKQVEYPREMNIIDIWRQQVQIHGHVVAVRETGSHMTYHQLDQASEAVATWLCLQHLPKESLVGVLAPRSFETIAVFLGILKAGLAYMPLDVNAPRGRNDAILSCASTCKLVILGSSVDIARAPTGVKCVHFDRIDDSAAQVRGAECLSATTLAYVMYTSGSTGLPKGVMIEHRGIVRLVKNGSPVERLPSAPELRIAHLSNLVFDASTWEIYAALLNGGTLVCIDHDTVLDARELGRCFRQHAVTAAVFTPALVRESLEYSPGTLAQLHFLHVGGDRFPEKDAAATRTLVPIVYNAYGPTENTVLSTIYRIQESETFANGVPIGTSINNSGAVVMDPRQQIVPPGVIGELVVTGDGLARGYIDAALDKDRFIQLTINGRMLRGYRTGDSVRLRPDGNIECLRRIDRQFKIRGHRVDLAEVEHTLLRQDDISDAVVVQRQRRRLNREDIDLVAFVTIRPQRSGCLSTEAAGTQEAFCEQEKTSLELSLVDKMHSQLPSYMVPTRIIVSSHLPRNARGKLDRHILEMRAEELPDEPAGAAYRNKIRPSNDTERIICEEFSRVLGIDEVHAAENFFELGGHSLMANRLAVRLSGRFNCRISVRNVFDKPRPVDLATEVTQHSNPYNSIPRHVTNAPVGLSFAQAGMLFLDQMISRTWYLYPLTLRVYGPLNVAALQQALSALEQRHDILRTVLKEQDLTTSSLQRDRTSTTQVVHPFMARPFPVSDALFDSQQFQSILQQEQTQPFDLAREPGWRVRLFRSAAAGVCTSQERSAYDRHDSLSADYILSIVMHHIIMDGWSVDILCRELSLFYSAACRSMDPLGQAKPLLVQYRDFTAWQQQRNQVTEHEAQLDFWLEQLADSEPLTFPEDFLRPPIPSGRAECIDLRLDEVLCRRFKQFVGFTPFMILVTAFRAAHYRLTAIEDATIGTPVANRAREELENVIGLFVNTQCIRTIVDEETTFRTLLKQVCQFVVPAMANQDVPFHQIVSKLQQSRHDVSKNPLVQVLFAVHTQEDLGQIKLEGLSTEMVRPVAPTTRLDMEVHLHPARNGFDGFLLFATDVYARDTAQGVVDIFIEVIKQAVSSPDIPLSQLPFVDGIGTVRIHEPNSTQESGCSVIDEHSVDDVFLQQVSTHPGAIAVDDGPTQLSYAQLDQHATRLAAWLCEYGLAAETLVGVMAPRSHQTITAYLAILKANLSYVPLDPNLPAGRVASLLCQQRFGLIFVTDSAQLASVRPPDIRWVVLSEALRQSQAMEGEVNLSQPKPTASSLAYVMFTSGSTGTPKGIMSQHGCIVSKVKGKANPMLPASPRVGHISNVMFDATTWELYTALLNGGTVVCIDHATVVDTIAFGRQIEDKHIQVSMMTPAVLKQLLRYSPSSLKAFNLLHVIGERLSVPDATQTLKLVAGTFYNSYGPTEATILSTSYMVPQDTSTLIQNVPIGHAIADTVAYVMDSRQHLVPSGVVGELVLAGPGIARGYTDSALDSDCFIDLLVDGHSIRAYRTGDRVRIRPRDGELEFWGRMDCQVKVRGQRVELGEIEQAIINVCKVATDAVVVGRETLGDGLVLVAFVVVEESDDLDSDARERLRWSIHQRLGEKLPAYMVPAQMVFISEVPLTANGKVDRKRLTIEAEGLAQEPSPDEPRSQRVPPRTSMEAALCNIYAEVLQRPLQVVGINDSFFALGGHSLTAMNLAARLSQSLGALISVRDVFDRPAIVDLAAHIDARAPEPPVHEFIVAHDSDLHAPLSFAQSRLWFLGQLGIGIVEYLMPLAVRLHGPLDTRALASAIQAIEKRHDVIRTTFLTRDSGEPAQVVHPYQPKDMRIVSARPSDVDEFLQAEQSRAFDLTQEPGWRVCLIQLTPNHSILSIVMHHIIADGWSIDLLSRELTALYKTARQQGDPEAKANSVVPLEGYTIKPLSLQYRDFAIWQRDSQTQTDKHQKQLEYWKQQLSGSQPADVICDYPRPPSPSGAAHDVHFTIDGPVYEKLLRFQEAHKCSLFMVLFAIFRATHYRIRGTEDATIGTPVANRSPEFQEIIGLFVNILCLRTTVSQSTTFHQLLCDVREASLAAYANRDVPFESIVSAIRPGLQDRNALVQMIVALHEQHNLGKIELEGLTTEQIVDSATTTRLDLELHVYQATTLLRGRLVFAKALFNITTGENIVSVFYEMLRRVLVTPDTPISQIPLTDGIPSLRERGLLAVQRTAYPREQSIVDVFRGQAAMSPEAVAVEDDLTQLTYAQLDKQSDILAQRLDTVQSLPRESLVGILASRSCETIVAMLGTLKADLAYLPLDEHAPASWNNKLLASAPSCKLILTRSGADMPVLSRADITVLSITQALSLSTAETSRGAQSEVASPCTPLSSPGPTSLAYVIFTSGSTGEPKGVMIEHRGVVRLMKDSTATRQLLPASRIAHLANTVFDASTWEIYGAILNGRTLVCIDRQKVLDPGALREVFEKQDIEAACFTPSLLRRCCDIAPNAVDRLKVLHIAGEVLVGSDLSKARRTMQHRLANGCGTEAGKLTTIYNAYGPTENSVASTIYEIPPRDFGNSVPIGRPIANSGAYVMSRQQQLVSPDVIGELIVTGDGLARGYLQSGMDTDRFIEIDDPGLLPGQRGPPIRAYRTGDIARIRHDGELECLGRGDQQVKIRGHRVELNAVEQAVVEACPLVQEAVAVTVNSPEPEAAGRDIEIMVYVTIRNAPDAVTAEGASLRDLAWNNYPRPSESAVTEKRILTLLRAQLPSHMIPTRIATIDSMPLNVSGKIDRHLLEGRASPLVVASRSRGGADEITSISPQNHIEAAVCEELALLRGVPASHIWLGNDFFELGGHSLLAARLAARLGSRLDVKVNVRDIFSSPILRDLAYRIGELRSSTNKYQKIPRCSRTEYTELSSAQARLWFLDRLDWSSTWYLMPMALRLRGPLNFNALETALQTIEQRHETLRTVFQQRDGIPVQMVRPYRETRTLGVLSCATEEERLDALREEQEQPFDLAAEAPWRVRLFRVQSDACDNILSLVIHHIVCDAWSVDVLYRELASFYSAACDDVSLVAEARPLDIQYRDFAAWERQTQQQDAAGEYRRQLDYWGQQLADSQPAELLRDHTRRPPFAGEVAAKHAGTVEFTLEGDVHERLLLFCHKHRLTTFVVLAAIFRATHYRLTGVEDATLATPVANRRNRLELENLIGFFVNTLCLRIKIEDGCTFRSLAEQVRRTSNDAQANQDVPFDRVVSEMFESRPGLQRVLSRNPLVQMLFAFHAQERLGIVDLRGLQVEPAPTQSYTRFDVEFHVMQGAACLNGVMLYSTQLFEPGTIQSFVFVFRRLLHQALLQPEVPIASLALCDITPTKRSLVGDIPSPLGAPSETQGSGSSIIAFFHKQVDATPDQVAVRQTDGAGECTQELTYRDLAVQSGRVAQWLRDQRLPPETPVALLAPRSCSAIVAILGIWKANLACVPLDPSTPIARLSTIVSSLPGPTTLVLHGDDGPSPTTLMSEPVRLARIQDVLCATASSAAADASMDRDADGASLACIFFTSGSTGTPKGVQIEHRGIVRLVTRSGAFGRTAHLTNLAFDVSFWEWTAPLVTGGCVICINPFVVLDPALLGQLLENEHVQTAIFTPALLKQCLNHSPTSLHVLEKIYVTGDRLDPADVIKLRSVSSAIVWNAYGPTENSIESTTYAIPACEADFPNGVPIGLAIPGTEAYVVDPCLRPVPAGVLGELIVTGSGLARGYTDSSLDRGRFVDYALDTHIARAYRTGDIARVRPKDRLLECFGRLDSQVKIRGHRIELGEIEHAILRHAMVDDVAVAIVERSPKGDQKSNEPELIAFLSARVSDDCPSREVETQVRDWQQHFDTYMFSGINEINIADLGRDFLGWKSMLDGQPINQNEMCQWLDDIVQVIVDGPTIHHVLEIGTGSGMILFNMPRTLASYVGIEPSRKAASFVSRMSASLPHLAGKVEIHTGTALDVNAIDGLRPDVVVLNSVVQYFPSSEYLHDVTNALIDLPGVCRIVFGDVRSLALHREFLVAAALHPCADRGRRSRDDLRRLVAQMADREEELLVDPAFFTSLQHRMPGKVKCVEILPKRMSAANELSSFRYNAVVHLHRSRDSVPVVHELHGAEWIDFCRYKLRPDDILQRLKTCPQDQPTVCVSNIPFANTIRERCVVDALDAPEEGEDWLECAFQKAASSPSMSLMELEHTGTLAGFRTRISWARHSSQRGGLDVVFHRSRQSTTSTESHRALYRFPTERPMDPHSCTNHLDHLRRRRLQASVRELVQEILPSYMLPARFHLLDRLPINASGKVDRRALVKIAQDLVPNHDHNPVPYAAYSSPQDDIEATLCDDFAHVLGMQPADISTSADFFSLGGHSLMATRLAARISRQLAQVSVRDIFEHPILNDLADHVRTIIGAAAYEPISRVEDSGGSFPLSFGQSRLYFLEQLDPTIYLVPVTIRLRGRLNFEALQTALRVVQKRHDTLRTTFHTTVTTTQPVEVSTIQVVHPHQSFDLTVKKLFGEGGSEEELLQALAEEQRRPFNLAQSPGFRACLFQLPTGTQGQHHVLSIMIHHIVCDGWSLDVLHRELSTSYASACLGLDPMSQLDPLPIQYTDFAVWQRAQEPEWEKQRQYWTSLLADSCPAELPTDFMRQPVPSAEAARFEFTVERVQYDRLRHFCKERRTTTFTVLLAIFRAAHFRLTGTSDALFASPIANRRRQEVQSLVGFFVNLQCMRVQIEADTTTLSMLVEQVRDRVAEALENQDLPFEELVAQLRPKHREMSRNPLAQQLFAVHQQTTEQIQLPHLICEPLPPVIPTTRFDLEFHMSESEQGLQGCVLTAASLYHRRTIDTLVSVFQEILRRGLEAPDTRIQDFELSDRVDDARESGLLDVARTDYPRDSSIVDLFRDQAHLNSGVIAVRHGPHSLTYAQLDLLSERLATWLSLQDLPLESVVGIFMSRSCEAIVTLLGILKAGFAYLPLDIQSPLYRTKTMISSIKACRVVFFAADEEYKLFASSQAASAVQYVNISDALLAMHKDAHERVTKVRVQPTNLAYVVCTSGSTGNPKAIMIEHRSVVRLVKNGSAVNSLPRSPCIAFMANFAFDACTWEIYAALLNGGTLICIDYSTVLDSIKLRHAFQQGPLVQAAFFTPALLRSVLKYVPEVIENLEFVFVGGERLEPDVALMARKLMRSKTTIANVYGPTENTAFSCFYSIAEDEHFSHGVPIGRPISNSGAIVADGQQRPVTAGVLGELIVTGDGLARGYTEDSPTSGAFFHMIQQDGTSIRAYRTGDRVRMRPRDGQLEYLGRVDDQVKIRGHRVELGDIECALMKQELVTSAAAILFSTDIKEEPELVAFITPAGDDPRDETQRKQFVLKMREQLQSQLPSYMIPTRMALVDQLPINLNGKVNRQALKALALGLPKITDTMAHAHTLPRDRIEEALCNLYGVVLQRSSSVRPVGIEDDFFDLGGHSLIATALVAHIRRAMKIDLAVRDVFERPTVRDLAAKLRELDVQDEVLRPNRSSDDEDYVPLQLLQDVADPESFVQNNILPQLTAQQIEDVLDVYPLSQLQKNFLCNPHTGLPHAFVDFYWDPPADADVGRMEQACRALVQLFDVFRTVIVPVAGVLYQVVLRQLDVPLEVRPCTEDLDTVSDVVSGEDSCSHFSYRHGQPLLRVCILQRGQSCARLLLQMSHAVYDGLSFEHMMRALDALLNHSPLPPAQSFARYMKHVLDSRKEGFLYWRRLLRGSTMTDGSRLRHETRLTKELGLQHDLQQRCHLATRTIEVPLKHTVDGITPATIFTAACAIVLAEWTSTEDVLFGRVVSGRQGLPSPDQTIVGPCANVVPVRALVPPSDIGHLHLLQQIQQQYIDGIPFETIGLDEIREHCTQWPHSTTFWCTTTYHDFSLGGAHISQRRSRLEGLDPVYELEIGGVARSESPRGLEVSLLGQNRSFKACDMAQMLDKLCRLIQTLSK